MLTWVWAPVTGSRKLNVWLTVLCWIHAGTNWGRLRYPLHSSEWMVEFATNFLLSTLVRVTLSLQGTISIWPLAAWKLVSTMPNTHAGLSATLPAFCYNKTEKRTRTNLSLCLYLKIASVFWNNHENFLCFPTDLGKNKYSILYKKRIWIKQLNLILNFYPGIRGKCITSAKGLKIFSRLNYLMVMKECLDLSEIRKSLLKL